MYSILHDFLHRCKSRTDIIRNTGTANAYHPFRREFSHGTFLPFSGFILPQHAVDSKTTKP